MASYRKEKGVGENRNTATTALYRKIQAAVQDHLTERIDVKGVASEALLSLAGVTAALILATGDVTKSIRLFSGKLMSVINLATGASEVDVMDVEANESVGDIETMKVLADKLLSAIQDHRGTRNDRVVFKEILMCMACCSGNVIDRCDDQVGAIGYFLGEFQTYMNREADDTDSLEDAEVAGHG